MDRYLLQAREALETATASMRERDLARSRAGKWSAAEIVEHCALACRGTARLLQWHLDKGRRAQEEPTEKQQLMVRHLIGGGRFPPGLQAPPYAVPRGMDPAHVLAFLHEILTALDEAVALCAERLGPGVTLGRHPVLGPLTGGQWCQFHAVHAAHHARQIEALNAWLAGEDAGGDLPNQEARTT